MARQHTKHNKETPATNKKGTGNQKKHPGNMPVSFFRFIVNNKSNLRFLLAGAAVTFIYFILLRIFFPAASFYPDSMAYIEAAAKGLEVSYRPIGYSNFISFFHSMVQSDWLLIFAQFFSGIIANLFLFFTLTYFFPAKKTYRLLLFVLLLCNPLYVLSGNYILSDAFFCSFSVTWFTVLLWIMHRPRWVYFFIQLVLLYWLILLSYTALIYPFIVAAAYLLSKQATWKKTVAIGIPFLVVIIMVNNTIDKTEDMTGTPTFSAWGGWQLANNSLFILRHVKADSASFDSKTSKEICAFSNYYFDSLKRNNLINYDDNVNSSLMFSNGSPLKNYMYYYIPQLYAIHPPPQTTNRYLTSWTIMGPIFEDFAVRVIKKYPLDYLRYFVAPNITLYFHPPIEAYGSYNNNEDTLNHLITTYYNYPSNKINQSHAGFIKLFMNPWSWIFTLINTLFLLLTAAYYFMRRYKNDAWFNKCLIFYLSFYALNFLFNIVAAPNVFRYHIAVVTLCIIFIVYLWQRVSGAKKSPVPA